MVSDQIEKLIREDREDALINAILQCTNKAELRAFLKDICTPQELGALSERLLTARILDHGDMSYRDISRLTGSSTTTIGRVARFLQQEPHKGYKLVLERLKQNK